MARTRLFARQRDGRIEVRLNEFGHDFVRVRFADLVAAQELPEHRWRAFLEQPIDPARDADDPLSSLERQKAVATNAELALLTADEDYLSEGEAWSWLSSLQHVLRAAAFDQGVVDYVSLHAASPEALEEIHALQQLLFDLSEALN